MAYSTRLEDYIFSLYQSIHIYEPEQLRIELIASRLGVNVEYIGGVSKTIHMPEQPLILINRHLTPEAQWQDFGHELGHLLRHCGNQMCLPPPFIELQEWQANNFALHFCIPTFMMEQLEFPWRKQEVIYLLARTFTVEFSFAAHRLERWLHQKESLYFWQDMSEAQEHYL
ncbi:ImmA/IrrE family metallo-endopeptidase [Pseudobacillus sp. FSL P4-0506]|uniref:ImmA/IrrE family metallo-endopeptidase n=1 Tax=Pseudobacillus sp. FSL P4-0506 TaxID=2921576 RepID=UPI0030F82DF0